MTTYVSSVRNVNEGLDALVELSARGHLWRTISPRGMETKEFKGTFITEYQKPRERVLFNAARDCNPFFHLMESIWILAGRSDVAFLAQYNAKIASFSDDGKSFHAPYGYRLRHHFAGPQGLFEAKECDQIAEVIRLLLGDPDTRRAVLCIWDPFEDLNVTSKDIPCNALVMLKQRDDILDMTVCCRSNDAIWGAYGANAVQFSMLQEFIASAIGAEVGVYRQVSDSFHIYTDNIAWKRVVAEHRDTIDQSGLDWYSADGSECIPYKLMNDAAWFDWLAQAKLFVADALFDGSYNRKIDSFFTDVARPVQLAWDIYKGKTKLLAKDDKNVRIVKAIGMLQVQCKAIDWKIACIEWLERRQEEVAKE